LLEEVFEGCKLGCRLEWDREIVCYVRILRLKLGVKDRIKGCC